MRNTDRWIAIENAMFRASKTEKTPEKTVLDRPQL